MFKNTASQKFYVFAFDATTSLPKTGDAANITAYIAKDFGAVTALTDTSATEQSSTNAPGVYMFDGTQAETNADVILVTGKSSTANVVVVGLPAFLETRPPNAGALSIDANGRVDVIKVAGTTQTARDLGASVLISSGTGTGQLSVTAGVIAANTTQWAGNAVATPNVSGVPIVDLKYTLGTISPAAAGSVRADAGDPLAIALPGAYSAGTMGYLIGTYLNASVSAVKAKTDNLPATPAATGDAMALTTAERGAVADKMLLRSIAGGADTTDVLNARNVMNALRALRNKQSISAGTLTVTKEDDATTAWTASVTTAAGDPITSIDPA